MLLRKINAGFSLICALLLLDHAVYQAARMLSRGSIVKIVNFPMQVLFILMLAHGILSIVLAIRGHKGAEKRKCKNYAKLNIATMIQRASGMSLIPLTVLHILGALGISQPPQAIHAILPPLFFTVVMIHTAISTSKAFITLGIGSAKFIKVADVVIKVIFGATLIADVAGFYLHQV